MVSQKQISTSGEIELGEFRRICQEVVDAIADYHADLSASGVLTDVSPSKVRALFAEELSQHGESERVSLAHWRERVVPKLASLTGLSELVSKNNGLLGALHNLVREHPDFEVLQEPILYLYCFRYVPNNLARQPDNPSTQALLDQLNQGIAAAVQRSGFNVTTTRLGDRVAIRMSICSHRTMEEDVDTIFEAIARWGRLLTKTQSICYEKPAQQEALPCLSEFCSSPMEV